MTKEIDKIFFSNYNKDMNMINPYYLVTKYVIKNVKGAENLKDQRCKYGKNLKSYWNMI